MNLRQVMPHVLADMRAGNAVTLISSPGVGKTDLMATLFRKLKASEPGLRWGMCVVFMATHTSVDFTGLPWKGERTFGDRVITITDPAVPGWYLSVPFDDDPGGQPAFMYDRILMVIEEWGQGEAETKRAAAELLRSGSILPWTLPPGSPRIALSNMDARDGVTKEFDFVINRRGEYYVNFDVNVWLEDFADKPYEWAGRTWNTLPVTKAWAKANPTIMAEPKPQKQGPWCTARSAAMADRYTQMIMEDNKGEIPVEDPYYQAGVEGKIGAAASRSYCMHLRFLLELPQYETVMMDPANTPIPARADLLLLMAYQLAGRVNPDDLAPCIQYVNRMRGDMASTFVSALLRRDYRGFIQQPAMQAWVNKNAALVSVIASLSK